MDFNCYGFCTSRSLTKKKQKGSVGYLGWSGWVVGYAVCREERRRGSPVFLSSRGNGVVNGWDSELVLDLFR